MYKNNEDYAEWVYRVLEGGAFLSIVLTVVAIFMAIVAISLKLIWGAVPKLMATTLGWMLMVDAGLIIVILVTVLAIIMCSILNE